MPRHRNEETDKLSGGLARVGFRVLPLHVLASPSPPEAAKLARAAETPSLPLLLIAALLVCVNALPPADMAMGGPVSVGSPLSKALTKIDAGLASVIHSIADSVADISEALRTMDFDQAGSTNSFGDDQLQADLHSDELIFKRLRACPAVESASSEEQSEILPMGGSGYNVAFDPLDGSSIFSANFAVGSIFGIWPGATPIGQTGRDMAAAAYSVYGPRTLLVIAIPAARTAAAPAREDTQQQQQQPDQQQCSSSSSNGAAAGKQQHMSKAFDVLEFVLHEGEWQLREVHTRLGNKNNVAPANIRAAAGNAAYQQLLNSWITSGCKLRYSGGMVPDVHHMLAKRGGVFCNPRSADAPAKLRLLYECAAMALIVEAAGGVSHDGHRSILDLRIDETGARTILALGSQPQVEQCIQALQEV